MKRLILLAGGILAMLQVTAQELPASIFVTAGIGVNMQKDDKGNTSKTFHVSPSVNYLLNERWSLGLFAEHSRNTQNVEMVTYNGTGYYTNSQSFEIKYRSLILGPQVRYYQPIAPKFFFLSEAQTGLKFEKQEVTQTYLSFYNNGNPNEPVLTTGKINSEAGASSVQVNLSPGLVYFIKPKFGIELKTNLISYNHGLKNSILPQEDAASRDFKVDLSMASTSFGASFYF